MTILNIEQKCENYRKKSIQDFNKWDWFYVSLNETLSEEFIEKYSDKVDWNFISECQKLSIEFVVKHKYKIKFNKLTYNLKLDFKKKRLYLFFKERTIFYEYI